LFADSYLFCEKNMPNVKPATDLHKPAVKNLGQPVYRLALLVFLCAAAVRLIVLFQFRECNALFENPVVDAWKYDMLAREFLRTGIWPEQGAFWQPPAYPFFLALVYKVFNESYTWARVIQTSLGSLSCVFVLLIGSALHSRRIGQTASLATAFYGPLVFFDLELLAPVLIVFWSTLGLLLLITGMQRASKIFLLPAGFAFGCALVAWPIVGLACGVTVIVILWSYRAVPKKAAALALLFSLGFLLPVMPVFFHNVQKGETVLVSTNGGINFYIGNNPEWQETVAMRPGYPWEKIVTLPNHRYGEKEVENQGSSAFFLRESQKFILSQPTVYMKNQLLKLYHVCFGYEIMRNTDLYFFKQFSPLLDYLILKGKWLKFPFGILFPLSLFGFFFSFRTTAKQHRYLVAYLLAVASGLVLFFVTCRYRVILVPILAIYGAIGFWGLVERLRRKSRNALLLLTLFVATFAAANIDFLDQEKHFDGAIYQAQAPFTLGRVYLEQGRNELAMAWLEKSVAIDPSYPDAWVDLGRAKYGLEDLEGGILAMHAAIRTAPDYPLPYFNLGLIYDGAAGDPGKALQFYRQFLVRAQAYHESSIRGTGRIESVRKRLAELTAKHTK
jgi:4-amino-4-deoxy-L-arabinose transferase-like glycosyltransferase